MLHDIIVVVVPLILWKGAAVPLALVAQVHPPPLTAVGMTKLNTSYWLRMTLATQMNGLRARQRKQTSLVAGTTLGILRNILTILSMHHTIPQLTLLAE